MMLVDTLGRKDPRALQVGQVEPTAIKFTQGQGSYDDMTPPWMVAAQEDWSGGRGSKEFEKDRSRFSDSFRVNTWREGALMLGPLETYAKYGDIEQHMPGDNADSGVTWQTLYGASRYYSTVWTQDGTWNVDDRPEVILRKVGSPGDLTLRLTDNNGGKPGTTLTGTGTPATGTLAETELPESHVSYVTQVYLNCEVIALGDTTVYHIEVFGDAGDDADDHWEIGTATGTTGGQKSANQSDYTGSQPTIYYRVPEMYTRATKTQTGWVTFEHKGALYGYTQPPTGNSLLYISGDRGVADSNAGHKDRLVDESKSWADDLHNGSIVRVVAGPGSEESQAWRTITDTVNNSGDPYLVVDFDWNVEHTTDTEYTIG